MFGLEILAKLFKILRSEASPNQIAVGLVIGMIIGLTPLFTFHNLVLFIILIIFKINIGMALFSMAIFAGIAYLFDPIFHSFGYYLLVDAESIRSFWIFVMDIPFLALSRYNNTVVTGSITVAIILIIPMFFFGKYFVIYYRKYLDPKLQKLKIIQIVKSSKFYKIYEKIKGIGG